MLYQRLMTNFVGYNDLILSDNPLAYYKLDDYSLNEPVSSGSTILDSSGNSRHLTVDNGGSTLFGHVGLVNNGGNSVYFNNDNTLYYLGTPSWVPRGNSERSIEFWADPEDGGPVIFSGHWATNGGQLWLGRRSISAEQYVFCNFRGCEFRYGPVSLGTIHVVFIVPTSAVNCSDAYAIVNGTMYSGTLNSGTDVALDTQDTYFRLGRTHDVTQEYRGYLDSVAVYDYAFTLSKAQAHYSAGL